MSSNSLGFRDLVLYVRLSIRETTQKQGAAGSFCTAGIQKQGEVIIICLSSLVLGELPVVCFWSDQQPSCGFVNIKLGL